MTLEILVAQLMAMGGLSALVAFLVNAGKQFGLVKDGEAMKYVTGLNLLALVGLFLAQTFYPALDIAKTDDAFGMVAKIGAMVLLFVLQMGISGKTNQVVTGAPVIGYSHSNDA